MSAQTPIDQDTLEPEDAHVMPEPSLPVSPPVSDPGFDLLGVENPSFAVLQEGRAGIFEHQVKLRAFTRLVEGLPDDGEQGRRKGLGLWMLGKAERAAELLAAFEEDDVAAYTRAKALLGAGRANEACPIFERLSRGYPDEPRPRGGWLEARLEADLVEHGEERALENLERGLAEAPASFEDRAELHFLRGRAFELRRDWEQALDHFLQARSLDPTLRDALYRAACIAERGGNDELALEIYQQLNSTPPCEIAVLMNLGMLYEDLGRDQDAAACYETVQRTMPTNERARLYLEDARQAIDMYYDEDLERQEDRLNQILRIPITDFELSVRARNCLNKMNINTLGDLVCRTEQELLSYKNFGETSLTEIKEILHSKGLRLGMPREEAVASVENAARRQSSTTDQGDVLNKPVIELQLSIRARRTVESLGCLTVGDITKHSTDELLGMPNFGVTSLQELKNKLAELSLKLRGE